jgi:hypothetical protein
VVERFVRIRKRKQVVQVIPADRTPAQMFRDEAWIESVYELAQFCQMFSSERSCGADRETNAVQTQGVIGSNSFECVRRNAVGSEEILAVNLKPGDRGCIGQYLGMMRAAKPDPGGSRDRSGSLERLRDGHGC